MIVLEALDTAAVRRWSRTAVDLLDEHRQEIDALNVFPVRDGDTGTNISLTLRAADDALGAARPTGPAEALAAMAGGAATGAAGNSGFIVSQILRGLADAAAGDGAAVRPARCDGPVVAAGLRRGAQLARDAVVVPVEGTILTVARAVADAVAGGTLGEVVASAVAAADAALQRTTSKLADLAAAGVVDAGGRGFVVLLDALLRTVTGRAAVLTPTRPPIRSSGRGPRPAVTHGTDDVTGPAAGDVIATRAGFGYEVQYLLAAPAPAVEALLATLAALGDSVAAVPAGPGVWKVHVHVDDIGAAIEAGVEAGRPHRITVVAFTGEHDVAVDVALRDDREHGQGGTAVVAVAPGAGLAHLFQAEGVHVVEASGVHGADGVDDADGGADSDGGLSVDDVVAEIRATGARELVLLPTTARVTAVTQAAAAQARAQGLRVSVVPTRSPVQGLAAIAVHDAGRRFDDDVVAMAEAAAATRFAELTVATDTALTAVGICQPGDVLGLIDGEVVEIGRGLLAVAFTLVDRLLGVGAELMTVLVGSGAPRRAGELIEAHVRGRAPLTDVTVFVGGQPDHPVVIGAE